MADLHRKATNPLVFVNGVPDRTGLRWLSSEQSAGGKRLDHAVFTLDLGVVQKKIGRPEFIRDHELFATWINAEVEVVSPDFQRVFHWGKIDLKEIQIGPGEELRLISRVANHHFGQPITYQRVADPLSGFFTGATELAYIEEEIVFNPEVDGQILPNQKKQGDFQSILRPLFMHPESVRTKAAAELHDSAGNVLELGNPFFQREEAFQNWDLTSAVEYLCVEANEKQRYIKNPSAANLQEVLGRSKALVKNHRIKPGLYLPKGLDALLEPYGFTWVIRLLGRGNRQIEVIPIGSGPEKSVFYQRPREKLDPKKSNAPGISLDYDIGSLANKVKIYGSKTQAEVTVELVPAWDPGQDDTDWIELRKDQADWLDKPEIHRAWRDWVAHEGGDYIGLRNLTKNSLDLTHAFREAFGDRHAVVIPRRRKFLPLLTRDAGNVQDIYVEVKINGNWVPLPDGEGEWAIEILETEMGIRFIGNFPPFQLWQQGQDLGSSEMESMVRVTATVESDTRVSGEWDDSVGSVHADVVPLVLDMSNAFHGRRLVRGGDLKSIFADRTQAQEIDISGNPFLNSIEGFPDTFTVPAQYQAAEVDSRIALTKLAAVLARSHNQAEASGRVEIEGLDWPDYAIGDIITKIEGREIGLRTTKGSPGAGGKAPQVVGISYDRQQQRTILHLTTFKQADEQLAALAAGEVF